MLHRPKNELWRPHLIPSRHFVYASPSVDLDRGESLLFVKYHDQFNKRLTYSGSVNFFEDDRVSTRIPNIRKLCNLDDTIPIRLLDVDSLTTFSLISASWTFKSQNLHTGSVLIVQKWPQVDVSVGSGKLCFPAYARHHYTSTSLAIFNPLLGKALHEQAVDGLYTDVALVPATPMNNNHFRLTAHKNVLATVVWFKAAFESVIDDLRITHPSLDNGRDSEGFPCIRISPGSTGPSSIGDQMLNRVDSPSRLLRVSRAYGCCGDRGG